MKFSRETLTYYWGKVRSYALRTWRKALPHVLRFGGQVRQHLVHYWGKVQPHILRYWGKVQPHVLRYWGKVQPYVLRYWGKVRPHVLRYWGKVRPHILHYWGKARPHLINYGGQVRHYFSNPYLLAGLGVLTLFLAIAYTILNVWIMPSFTRHGESVTVPSVVDFSIEEAAKLLQEAGLESEQVILRKPNLPRDVVIDQIPLPQALVKPGRRVYLTVNAGDTTTVRVPNVESFPIREARSRITVHGLRISAVLPDSIPSPHANTITRQSPRAGANVPSGTSVTLWYGTGLGDQLVTVPDITGLTVNEAKEQLLALRLRSVVIGKRNGSAGSQKVIEQGTPAGTSVKEGFEIRLRLESQEESLDDINN